MLNSFVKLPPTPSSADLKKSLCPMYYYLSHGARLFFVAIQSIVILQCWVSKRYPISELGLHCGHGHVYKGRKVQNYPGTLREK